MAEENIDKEKCILDLRKMMLEDENLKILKSEDAYLERFLISTEFDVDAAFKRMKDFYETLAEHPTWFTKMSPAKKKDILEKDIRILLQKKDKEGRPLYIVKIANMDPGIMELIDDVVAIDDFCIETLFLLDYSGIENGICVILDISNFSLKITRWLTPSNVKIAIKRILSMPIKEFRFHVINSSMMVHVAIKIIWPFLPQQIKDSVKFHFSDYEALYQYVDKDVLPEEYGGKIKLDCTKQHSIILDRDEDIIENFKVDRFMYLDTINPKNKESDE